jgi:hypothetical protein
MKRKYSIYVVLIALLAAVNLWRWWPAGTGASEGRAPHNKVVLPEDFRLRVDAPLAPGAFRRDLFQAGHGMAATMIGLGHAAHVAAKPPAPSVPAFSQPAQAETADAELAKFKLLGVVFRAGRGHAYLALDKENMMAISGETLLGRFAVDKVAVDGVELRDLRTNTSRRIPVSGK